MQKVDLDRIDKPKGHEKYSNDEVDKCPVMQMQVNQQNKENQLISQKDIEKSPKKEKKPKGGCPFMPSDKKKNPPLGSMELGYDQAFVSQYQHFFSYCPLLDIALSEKPRKASSSKIFESYPIYLKHSLMIDDDENMIKVREMEISKRFFCYDRFREKGNKEFYKENYDIALQFYERALHCFQWLYFKPPPEEEEKEQECEQEEGEERKTQEKENDFAQENTKNSKAKDPLMDDLKLTEKEEEEMKAYSQKVREERKQFKQKYKNLMKTYNDDTVHLYDGQDLIESTDIDMRNSMMHTIFLIMAVCYMKLNHFKLAREAIEESIKISDKPTQLYYRRSQAIAHDRWSNLDALEKAKKDIELAIEMKKFEKIFNDGQAGILKIMNLHNHEEAYREQAIFANQRIIERKIWEKEKLDRVLMRVKRIQEIEQEMIKEGKTPQESIQREQDDFDEKLEMIVVHEMVKKYYKAIEFYTESKKPDQVSAAKFQLQKLLETVQEMMYFFEFDYSKNYSLLNEVNQKYQLDLTSEKVLKRLNRISKEKSKELFEQGKNFNFEIFKWALDDVLKIKSQRMEEKEREEKELKKKNNPSFTEHFWKTAFSPSLIIQVFVFMIMLICFMLWIGQSQLVSQNIQSFLKDSTTGLNFWSK